jgi:hypothetical protein
VPALAACVPLSDWFAEIDYEIRRDSKLSRLLNPGIPTRLDLGTPDSISNPY